MKRLYLFYAIILSTFLFSSCFRGMIQKAYITNPPNVCLFDSAKSKSMKFGGNLRYIENQLSFGLTDKLGLASNLLVGFKGQYGGDLGLVYYKNLKNNGYFEFAAGYGYFNVSSAVSGVSTDIFNIGPYGTFYKHYINSSYHKLYLQPSIFSRNKETDIGFTLRISLPYFTNYDCSYDVTQYDGEFPSFSPEEYGNAYFKNKFGLTFEPMVTLRFNKNRIPIYIQFGGCISDNNIYKLDAYEYNVSTNNPRKYTYNKTQQQFPLHANFFINWGIDFNIGKSVKRKIENRPPLSKPDYSKAIQKAEINLHKHKENQIKSQSSFWYNFIVMHKKNGRRDYIFKPGKGLKILTFDNKKIKGKLIMIKDSSVVIVQRDVSTEVAVKNIKCVYGNISVFNNLGDGFLVLCAGLATGNAPLFALSFPIAGYEIFHVHRRKYDSKKYEYLIFR